MKILGCLLGFTVLLSACGQGAPTVDTSLGSANSERFEDLLNAADVDGLVSLYTEDARVMPPNGSMKRGHAAVRDEFGAMIAAGITGDLTSLESKAVGDVAYNLGTYELQIDGGTIDKGKWMETWQRGGDGTWRISNDIWNSDMPAMPAEGQKMTHMIGTHRVEDAGKWLAAWRGEDGRRKQFAEHGAPHVHVMQSPDDPNLTGLVIGLSDPAAFEAWLNSDEGQAAAAEDTVDMSTLTLLVEVD
ncbi:MAG: DUF4440 domain-containing protein [Woeseia sp.]|nr:DUF4440 domain-containing protein [Woeseia sp.]MBT8097265.1 DUF4440 domain-containing protein [Woeseia sp.]NNE59628.1 DUF4440 domain-containing protein [Woeseia sp.]NNL54937.1 DUF4440 domain-containing protein [Woeseia sp.]